MIFKSTNVYEISIKYHLNTENIHFSLKIIPLVKTDDRDLLTTQWHTPQENTTDIYIYVCVCVGGHLPDPPHKQDVTQGQFYQQILTGFNSEFLDWLPHLG